MKKYNKTKQQVLLGGFIRKIRKRQGVRQDNLARKLLKPQSFISKVETGERSITFFELEKIIMHLGLELSVFITEFQKYRELEQKINS